MQWYNSRDIIPSISWIFYDSQTHDLTFGKKRLWDNINCRAGKESRTEMESATFETLETTVFFSVIICISQNRRNATFLQQSRCPPMIYPLEQPKVNKKSTSLNQILEVFICIEINAECNETTPAIAVDRFHGDSDMSTKLTPHYHQNNFRNIIKREVW